MGFLKKFFMVVGIIVAVLFVLAVAVVLYLVVKKPLGVDVTQLPSALIGNEVKESTYDHPFLSTDQEVFLEKVGVDTKTLPTSITDEQKVCAVEALGVDRVNEIVGGATPSLFDYQKAKDCF